MIIMENKEYVFLKYTLILILLLFTLIPVIYLLLYSFLKNISSGFSWPYIEDLLFNERWIRIFLRTLFIAFLSSIVGSVLGIYTSFILFKTNFRFKKIFRILTIIPLLIPPYTMALAWINLLTKSKTFEIFGYSIYNLYFASIILALSFFPISTFFNSFSLRRIGSNIEDSAILLHKKWKVFRKITFPLMLPSLIASFLLIFVLSISEFGVASVFRTNSFISEIYYSFSAFFNYEEAITLLLPLYTLSFIFVIVYFYFSGRKFEFPSGEMRIISLSPFWQIFNVVIFSFIIIFSVIAPITSLFLNTDIEAFLSSLREFRPILHSLFAASTGALLAVLIAFPIGYIIKRDKYGYIVRFLALLPITLPGMVLGISYIHFFNKPELTLLYGSVFLLIMALCGKVLPYLVLIFNGFFETFPKSLEESAYLLGKNIKEIFRKIIIPLFLPAILIAWLMAAIFLLRDLGLSLLLHPPGFQTIPVRLFIIYHIGNYKEVSALSLILIVINLILSYIIHKLFERGMKYGNRSDV